MLKGMVRWSEMGQHWHWHWLNQFKLTTAYWSIELWYSKGFSSKLIKSAKVHLVQSQCLNITQHAGTINVSHSYEICSVLHSTGKSLRRKQLVLSKKSWKSIFFATWQFLSEFGKYVTLGKRFMNLNAGRKI
jgi:hypothetical protein